MECQRDTLPIVNRAITATRSTSYTFAPAIIRYLVGGKSCFSLLFIHRFCCVLHGEDARQAAIKVALIGVHRDAVDSGDSTRFLVGGRTSSFSSVGRLRRILQADASSRRSGLFVNVSLFVERAGFFSLCLFDASNLCNREALGASRTR
jgi:hypothetical protein